MMKHMQSMDSVLLCRNAFRATCDAATTVKCVSSAYAKLMLCLPLPLASATVFLRFLRRLLEKGSKKDFSKAYAMHMKYIRVNEDNDENLKRRGEFGSA